MERIGNPALAPKEHYTYGHYRTWPDEERWEIIEGRPWSMMQSYGTRHQSTIGSFLCAISSVFKKQKAQLMLGPFDVLLPIDDEPIEGISTIFQPDLCIYLDRSKVGELFGLGPPDLVVEVVNPRTAKKDYNDKFRIYENRGVAEYWIVDPFCSSIQVFKRIEGGRFDFGMISESIYGGDPLHSSVIPGFVVEAREFFAEKD